MNVSMTPFRRVLPIRKTSTAWCYKSFLARAWLAKARANVSYQNINPCQNIYRKKISKSAKYVCHYATKNRPAKITMYLGLDIINKLKFTTDFDRCAILNVLACLTKNFES